MNRPEYTNATVPRMGTGAPDELINRVDPLVPPIVNVRPLVRRNEPCRFCASGRKFKFCCGRAVGTMPSVRK